MRLLFALLTIGGMIGGGLLLVQKGLVHLPNTVSLPTISKTGTVKGISITNIAPVSSTVGSLANAAMKAGNAIGIQTIQKSQEFVQNVANTPAASADVINVGQAVSQIQSQVQNLPSTIAQQAQIEYCKQVFANATQSAK